MCQNVFFGFLRLKLTFCFGKQIEAIKKKKTRSTMASIRLAHELIDFASVPNSLEIFYLLGPWVIPK